MKTWLRRLRAAVSGHAPDRRRAHAQIEPIVEEHSDLDAADPEQPGEPVVGVRIDSATPPQAAAFVEAADDVRGTVERAGPAPGPILLRQPPFKLGFFGAIGAMLAVLLVQALLGISSILILIVVAVFLALGLNPLVEWFMRRGVRRGWAVLMVLVLVLAVLVGFVLTLAPVISEQIAQITKNAPTWLQELQDNPDVQRLDERFSIIDRVQDYVQKADFGASVFGGALGVGLKVLSVLTNSLIVIVLTIYFLVSLPTFRTAAYRLAPASRRPRVADLGDKIIRSTGAYVGGATLVAVCAAISTLIFTFVIGLGEYSFALAFIVGLLSLIPVLGAFVSAFIITLIGLTVSPTVALITLIYYLAYQQFESYVISPRIMARSIELPGVVTVLAALIGGSLLGIIGALLAVPTASALLILHREVFLVRQDAR